MRDLRKRIDSFRLTRTENMSVSVGMFGSKPYIYLSLARVTPEETLLALGRTVNVPAEYLERLIAALSEARDKLATNPDTWTGGDDA